MKLFAPHQQYYRPRVPLSCFGGGQLCVVVVCEIVEPNWSARSNLESLLNNAALSVQSTLAQKKKKKPWLTHPACVHSTVRGAMVEVMIAGASLEQHHPRALSSSHSLSGLVEEDSAGGGAVQQPVAGSSSSSSSSDDICLSGWSNALAAENGPRDPSTCILWGVIALGALVRGCPVDYVGAILKSCCCCRRFNAAAGRATNSFVC